MESQKEVFGWLDEATLFPVNQEQVGVHSGFCFDGLIFPEDEKAKEHDVDALDIQYVSDIFEGDNWMDSKIDLSILDSAFPECLPSTTEDKQKTEVIDIGLEIESLVDTYFQQNALLPFETNHVDSQPSSINDIYNASTSSEVLCTSEATTSHIDTLPEAGLQLPSSPLDSSWSATSSPAKVPSISDDNLSDTSESSSNNDQEFIPLNYFVEVSLDDGCSGKINKSSERKTPKLKLVKEKTYVQSFSPYHLKKEIRRERKKVQNKEAAARYRTKKREQDKVLTDEVEALEEEQEKLQSKHDELKTEIKYLKSLMRDMFKARGLLK